MAQEYMPVVIQFKGKHRTMFCHRSEKCSALVAITNMSLLLQSDINLTGPLQPVDPQGLMEEVVDILKETISNLAPDKTLYDRVNGKEAILEKIASSMDSPIALDPMNTSCNEFTQTDELLLLNALETRLLHGWIFDKEDKHLDFVKGVSHSNFHTKIAEAEQGNSSDALRKKLNDFMNARITTYGLSCLLEAVEEGELAILYDNNEYHVLHKHGGDLFTLEASEEIITRLPDAVWKKLTVEEKDSFHVKSSFTPTNGQPKEKQKLADAWILTALDKPTTKKKKKKKTKPKSKGNLTEGLEEEDKGFTYESSIPISNVGSTEDVSTSKEPTPQTTADRFLEFLSVFQDGANNNVPYFERIAKEMIHPSSFELCVPFEWIQKHDGNLAIDIQDESPGIHNDLVCSVAAYLNKIGLDKSEGTSHPQLKILNLPEPKCHRKFLQFVDENDLSATYTLYDGILDCTTTVVGRNMGLGYLNDILDKFEIGKCWLEGWDPTDMEVRDNGREFIISKEPDADLTADLGVANLLNFVDIVLSRYTKEGISPAYFDSFVEDILMFPKPKEDPAKWNRFVRYMRSPFALKAPLARSTLICEACRVISLQVDANPSMVHTLTMTTPNQWREKVRTANPFSHVYRFRNGSYLYFRDKWEPSHWHVVKYSRNFIEHVLIYLKAMFGLHDIVFVELILARQLEYNITGAIRTIVFEYGVDGLFSSSWDHFECSNCNKMPLQLTQNEIIGLTTESIAKDTELEVKLVVRLSTIKSDDHVTPWYSEVGFPSGSSPQMLNPKLLDFKQLLEEKKEFHVECSTDDLSDEDRESCIVISKIMKAQERKIVVQGPFCADCSTILRHLHSWLFEVTK